MTEYRRFYIPKAMWSFTVNLAERKNECLMIDKIDELRNILRYVKQRKPFHLAFQKSVLHRNYSVSHKKA